MPTLEWDDRPHVRDYELVPGDSVNTVLAIQMNAVAKALNGTGASSKLTVWDEDGAVKINERTITPSGTSNNELKLGITATDSALWTGTLTYKIVTILPSADATFSEGATGTLVKGSITMEPIP